VADGLPALGIVAAVLGVIKTMASIDQPPEILGKLIGGALVGTFLGVFLSYGIVGPMANKLRGLRRGGRAFLQADPRSAGGQPAQPRDQHLHRGRPPEHAAPRPARATRSSRRRCATSRRMRRDTASMRASPASCWNSLTGRRGL
jgi:hypothetical protein